MCFLCAHSVKLAKVLGGIPQVFIVPRGCIVLVCKQEQVNIRYWWLIIRTICGIVETDSGHGTCRGGGKQAATTLLIISDGRLTQIDNYVLC